MAELWFAIAALSIAAYVVLDGFDFGAGALHLFVARNDEERRQVLAAIGPYWDGNEVWLLASGGVLFVAFPRVLASGLSGFYFAIFLVLWALILRAIGIEFRHHIRDPLWTAAWDAVFWGASTLLPVLFGAALGNLIRGFDIDGNGWFSLWLFTDFSGRAPVGILDWYTVSAGVFALIAVTAHGATFLAWKTDGAVNERSRRAASSLYGAVLTLIVPMTLATSIVNHDMLAAVRGRPLAWLALAIAIGGLAAAWTSVRSGKDFTAFLGSCAFLAGMLGATAACLFPVLLRSIDDASRSLTVYNSSVPAASLRIAIRWWLLGIPLVVVYFATVFRLHRGKAQAGTY
jgi:cytochrome bd ubiquinol oxidase subunit II